VAALLGVLFDSEPLAFGLLQLVALIQTGERHETTN
jgi:hypothetical protein